MGKKPIQTDDDLSDWDHVIPVGREFGSADYERLAELDHLAFKALGAHLKARQWLDEPNHMLGGQTPEEVAKTQKGFERVKKLLRTKEFGEQGAPAAEKRKMPKTH
ncbi:MAG: hypothetical protein A3J24_09905 [Deltaproteobacteria bacterium RIFCSPLOWO2_02_FULL_53_8]|nr:MAG: hypothetical protein A3J24_09905 [Deltaproteobacteria bacterium RIFCSPLOWO2_02_FULL_53_8]